jgi:hypothetical protein
MFGGSMGSGQPRVSVGAKLNVLHGKKENHKDMPNTGERREITARSNAQEAETVRESQKLLSKTKQLTASKDAKSRMRSSRALKDRSRERTA